MRGSLFPELKIRGVVLTMFDSRTNLSTDVVNEVKRVFPDKVYKTIIPRSIRLAKRLHMDYPFLFMPRIQCGKSLCFAGP
jgi:chromosome partitioning protein